MSHALVRYKTPPIFWILTGIHFLVKIVFAGTTALGNDEVYYLTYAQYPDFSHFDHPPMLGFLIQLMTLNLWFDAELMIRIGGIILSSVNMFLVYHFVKKYSSKQGALFAVIAYQSSIYLSVIVGLFILPDTVQATFWLLSIYTFSYFIDKIKEKKMLIHWKLWILLGGTIGLSILSKYHGVFVGFAVFLFVLLYAKKEFSKINIYLLITVVLVSVFPILYWNIKNDFISYQFHTERVASVGNIDIVSFFRELFGQALYQNPFIYLIYLLSIIQFVKRVRGKHFLPVEFFLILVSLPIILTFLFISLFKETLPHWSGPGFIGLLLLSGIYFDSIKFKKKCWIGWGLTMTCLLLLPICINYLPYNLGSKEVTTLGEYDFTQDMYGWTKERDSINYFLSKYEKEGIVEQNTSIVDSKWFPGSHVDFYIAQPLNRKFFLVGNLKDIHKYYWINKERNGLMLGSNYYYFAHSNHPINVNEYFSTYFESVVLLDSFTLSRMKTPMRHIKIYLLKRYKG